MLQSWNYAITDFVKVWRVSKHSWKIRWKTQTHCGWYLLDFHKLRHQILNLCQIWCWAGDIGSDRVTKGKYEGKWIIKRWWRDISL